MSPAAMPSHVRIFWLLSVAIVAYWVLSTVWFLAFPSAHYLATLAKLPPELREPTRRIDLEIEIITTSVWSALTLGSAWLASFRRRNWGRWAFAGVFVLGQAIPFLIAVYYHMLGEYLVELAHQNWTDPWRYVTRAPAVAAIAFVFTGNARDWFRRPAAVA